MLARRALLLRLWKELHLSISTKENNVQHTTGPGSAATTPTICSATSVLPHGDKLDKAVDAAPLLYDGVVPLTGSKSVTDRLLLLQRNAQPCGGGGDDGSKPCGTWRLKPHLRLHLYISDAPCGDASIYEQRTREINASISRGYPPPQQPTVSKGSRRALSVSAALAVAVDGAKKTSSGVPPDGVGGSSASSLYASIPDKPTTASERDSGSNGQARVGSCSCVVKCSCDGGVNGHSGIHYMHSDGDVSRENGKVCSTRLHRTNESPREGKDEKESEHAFKRRRPSVEAIAFDNFNGNRAGGKRVTSSSIEEHTSSGEDLGVEGRPSKNKNAKAEVNDGKGTSKIDSEKERIGEKLAAALAASEATKVAAGSEKMAFTGAKIIAAVKRKGDHDHGYRTPGAGVGQDGEAAAAAAATTGVPTASRELVLRIDREQEQTLGALRIKSSRSNMSEEGRTMSMSCSDKLAKWAVLGVQVCAGRCRELTRCFFFPHRPRCLAIPVRAHPFAKLFAGRTSSTQNLAGVSCQRNEDVCRNKRSGMRQL